MKMQTNADETKRITLEQVVAGCLLEWQQVDGFILYSVIDILEDEGFEIVRPFDFQFTELYKYACFRKVKSPKSGYIFVRKIDGANIANANSLDEKLEGLIPTSLAEFFEENGDGLLKLNSEPTERAKRRILNDANVLLISDKDEDYDAFKSYGFRNITFFKSIILADDFFKRRPAELSKFHIFITGSQIAKDDDFATKTSLENDIARLKHQNPNKLSVDFDTVTDADHSRITAYISNPTSWRRTILKTENYADLLDSIISSAKHNGVLYDITPAITQSDLEGIIEKKQSAPLAVYHTFAPMHDFPSTLKDLKILYLDPIEVESTAPQMAEELGLDVTFMADDNLTFDKIKTRLGEFDIIVGSSYSRILPYANIESTEQSRKTGTPLILLASYDWKNVTCLTQDRKVLNPGLSVELDYQFGGLVYATNSQLSLTRKPKHIEIRTPFEENSDRDEYTRIKTTVMRTILNSIVHLYDAHLSEITKSELPICELKHPRDFERDFTNQLRAQEERELEKLQIINKKLAFIGTIDRIFYFATEYLKLPEEKRHMANIQDIKIAESQTGIRITMLYHNSPLCALTLSKNNDSQDIRIFTLETLTKKGKLTDPVTLGICARGERTTLQEPDDEQTNRILTIYSALENALLPILPGKKSKKKTFSPRPSYK